MYGLTMAAIEQVAQQGLACVTHMSIEVRDCLLSVLYTVWHTNHLHVYRTGCTDAEENSL